MCHIHFFLSQMNRISMFAEIYRQQNTLLQQRHLFRTRHRENVSCASRPLCQPWDEKLLGNVVSTVRRKWLHGAYKLLPQVSEEISCSTRLLREHAAWQVCCSSEDAHTRHGNHQALSRLSSQRIGLQSNSLSQSELRQTGILKNPADVWCNKV